MSKFNLELLLKIVSAVIKAVVSVLYGITDISDNSDSDGTS